VQCSISSMPLENGQSSRRRKMTNVLMRREAIRGLGAEVACMRKGLVGSETESGGGGRRIGQKNTDIGVMRARIGRASQGNASSIPERNDSRNP